MVAEVSKVGVHDVFWNMPLVEVFAYEHCWYSVNGIDCKRKGQQGVGGAVGDAVDILWTEKEEELEKELEDWQKEAQDYGV